MNTTRNPSLPVDLPHGPASQQQLQELHRLLVEDLLARMSPQAKRRGIDLLGVVGTLLRQEGVTGRGSGVRRQRQLQALFESYVSALGKGLREGPSSGVLVEVGRLLRFARVVKDISPLPAGTSSRRTLEAMADPALPFKKLN